MNEKVFCNLFECDREETFWNILINMSPIFSLIALFLLSIISQLVQGEKYRNIFCLSLSALKAAPKKRNADNRTNKAHDKSNKIKLAPKKEEIETKQETRETDVKEDKQEDEAAVIQRQATKLQVLQVILSIGSMLLSRKIFQLDFKNEKILQISRIIFSVYVLLNQLLFWIIKKQIEDKNDDHIAFLMDRLTKLTKDSVVERYIGVDIKRNRKERTITVSQKPISAYNNQ